MVMIATASSADRSTDAAIAESLDVLASRLKSAPDYLMVHTNAAHDIDTIQSRIRERYPETAVHGATSCFGTMTDKGLIGGPDSGLGIWAFADPDGDVGTGLAEFGQGTKTAAETAIRNALAAADRPGEVPQLVWVSAAPGHEEDVIAGIQAIVGADVPIIGGSAADNAIVGDWKVFTEQGTAANGLVVSAWFSPLLIGTAFHSGYRPTDKKATVTEARDRVILSLDGRPAVEVYREWTGLDFPVDGDQPTNILQSTTLKPLGRKRGRLAGASMFVLCHPETTRPDGGISLFAKVDEGEELYLMEGSTESLIRRPGNVCNSAMAMAELSAEDVKGAILVYCAGCMLTVQERMPEVHREVCESLPGVPFVTAFTFGEQGPVIDEASGHGNLMISAVLFGER